MTLKHCAKFRKNPDSSPFLSIQVLVVCYLRLVTPRFVITKIWHTLPNFPHALRNNLSPYKSRTPDWIKRDFIHIFIHLHLHLHHLQHLHHLHHLHSWRGLTRRGKVCERARQNGRLVCVVQSQYKQSSHYRSLSLNSYDKIMKLHPAGDLVWSFVIFSRI